MSQEPTSANAPSQVGEGGNGGDLQGDSARPEELQLLQDVKLVVDVGDGRTIVIPLKGHLTIHHSSQADTSLPFIGEQSNGGAAQGQSEVQRTAQGQAAEQNSGGEEQRQRRAEQEDAEAKKYFNDMRGWIMTVATLFIGMSFQALTQRPSWMPEPKHGLKFFLTMFGTSSKDSAQEEADQVLQYVFWNTMTFSFSLLLVLVLLLLPKDIHKPKIVVKIMTTVMTLAGSFFSLNFSLIFKNKLTKRFVGTLMAPTLIILVAMGGRFITFMASEQFPRLTLLASKFPTFRQRNLVRSGEDNGEAQVQLPTTQEAA